MGRSVQVTIHYHGTPISPRSVLRTLAGKFFCVSFASPQDVDICHDIGQGVMLDNGAFSFWRQGGDGDWPGYYQWCEEWIEFPTTWAVIPDVIDGTGDENDILLGQWPHGDKGSPVWHMHEPISRLLRLVKNWSRVCFGSSGQFATVGDSAWCRRADDAFNALSSRGSIPWIHMLRGMALSGSEYPFASVDSTDVARNHNRPQNNARVMADRWDSKQCPSCWVLRSQMKLKGLV